MKRLLFAVLACCALARAQAPAMTTISDALFGTAVSITVRPASVFTTSDGFVLSPAYSVSSSSATGVVSLALPPNPPHTYYTARIVTPVMSWTETWVVPVSATPVKLINVRAELLPSPSYVIAASQLSAPAGCAIGQFLELASGSWTCGASTGGGSMVYPAAGVATSTGTAWGASYGVGTGANDLAQLDGSGLLPPAVIPALSYQSVLSSFTAPAHQFLTGFAAPGTYTSAQPGFADISGQLAAGQLPSSYTAPLAQALAATPTPCSVGQYVSAVAADGTLTCSAPPSTMVYPGAGLADSTGSAWGSSFTVGTGANDLVQLDGSGRLPAVSAANLTGFPTLNQSTTGNAATATALAATPSQCTSGQFATGIAASGNANCGTPSGGSPITTWADPFGSGSGASVYNGGTANAIGCYEVFIPNSFTLGHFVVDVTTADASNNNDIALYTTGGNRLADIGAQTFGATGVKDIAIAGGGTITEPAGAYFFCITTASGTLRLQGASNQIGPNGTVLVSSTTSTGGALPATITPPTPSWQLTSRTPTWAFH